MWETANYFLFSIRTLNSKKHPATRSKSVLCLLKCRGTLGSCDRCLDRIPHTPPWCGRLCRTPGWMQERSLQTKPQISASGDSIHSPLAPTPGGQKDREEGIWMLVKKMAQFMSNLVQHTFNEKNIHLVNTYIPNDTQPHTWSREPDSKSDFKVESQHEWVLPTCVMMTRQWFGLRNAPTHLHAVPTQLLRGRHTVVDNALDVSLHSAMEVLEHGGPPRQHDVLVQSAPRVNRAHLCAAAAAAEAAHSQKCTSAPSAAIQPCYTKYLLRYK